MDVTLYRGITVRPEQADEITKSILKSGLDGTEGNWKFMLPADIAGTQVLARQSIKQPSDFDKVWDGPTVSGLCACGSIDGAAYYANKHNLDRAKEKTFPLQISLRTSLDQIYIDCRDFLMPAFQLFDRVSNSHVGNQRKVLAAIFGEAVLPYFDACVISDNRQERVTLGDMASFDIDAIRSHLTNAHLITGRYKTQFRSAFFVLSPVNPQDILEVTTPDLTPSVGRAYSLDDFFGGKAI